MLDHDHSISAMLQGIAEQCRIEPVAVESVAEEEPNREPDDATWSLPGFGAGALVATSFGHVPVELLRRRDAIRTPEGRFLRVQYVDKIQLDRRYLLTHPEAQPVNIHESGVAPSMPERSMLVSACQKIVPPQMMRGQPPKAAVDYIGRSGIRRKSHGYFTYYVFHCGEPCMANVNGLWMEIDPSALEISRDELD